LSHLPYLARPSSGVGETERLFCDNYARCGCHIEVRGFELWRFEPRCFKLYLCDSYLCDSYLCDSYLCYRYRCDASQPRSLELRCFEPRCRFCAAAGPEVRGEIYA